MAWAALMAGQVIGHVSVKFLLSNVFSPRRKQPSTPAKESSKEQLLCPDYAVYGLVRCVADCAHWISLCARLLWRALKALRSMLRLSCPILKTVVHCHLHDMPIVSSFTITPWPLPQNAL